MNATLKVVTLLPAIKSARLVGLLFTLSLTNQSSPACVVTKYTTNETH